MSEYTPGPWIAIRQRGEFEGNYCIGRIDDHGKGPLLTFVSVHGPHDIVPPEYGCAAEANARLIAAAPEVTESLMELYNWYKGDNWKRLQAAHACPPEAMFRRMQAALTKALDHD